MLMLIKKTVHGRVRCANERNAICILLCRITEKQSNKTHTHAQRTATLSIGIHALCYRIALMDEIKYTVHTHTPEAKKKEQNTHKKRHD